MNKPDRRQDPRTSLQSSIRRWLQAESRREGFEALVVADGEGLVVAASETTPRSELLAAVAPLDVSQRSAVAGHLDVVSRPVTLLGSRYYLCGARRSRPASLEPAVGGVERILAA